jgi:predicted site-specific integrase-resolvase
MIDDELLTSTETARILCVSRQTLLKMRQRGDIEAFYKGTNKYNIVFKKADVMAYQAKQNTITTIKESK